MVGDGPSPSFREMLVGPRFCYGAELVTTRGTSETAPAARLVELGEALAADERIDWISVTDNPGGAPMLPADWLARILAERRSEVVIHLTCKDLNRNGLESSAWRFASEGFANLLALTGDYPSTGYGGLARPVFDLDSVGLIALLHAMNTGLPIPGRGGSEEVLPRTGFFIGCAVSPFKRHERELMPQFFKLARKLRCGAQWVIPQLGFDMRKFHEVLLFLQRSGPAVPVIGNVYILNKTVAGIFNKGTKIKLVYRDKRVGRITDVFGLPASELSDEQLATEGLQEKEINWEAAVEPKLPKATAKATSAFEKAFKQMKDVIADMNDCERAKKDIAGWKRNILVKTPGGRCVIVIDNGEIAIKKGGTTKQDFVMVAKNPNTILNGLAYKGSLTEAIMMADLWISKNIEFMTVFKLERMARSLARSRK